MCLLMSEVPIHFSPTLAKRLGLNEAIVLHQIHYRLKVNYKREQRDHRYWVFNSFENWAKEFFFLPKDILRQTFQSLVEQEILLRGDFALNPLDSTEWYSINSDAAATISTCPC